ncbi:hypothetical protein BB8028_0002g03800 [Beauveria bassiana]|uniref:1,3-beta-glucanosyltransferase n=1 Tax=Beauveria bassiana TaxID=176275 RepID=A0A2S7Y1N1_BEABA|nr:hypothetical protein BB8028_0002g03800 [Beauveria bassiana]
MVSAKTLIASLAAVGALAADVPSLQIKGSKFFYPNGTQFIIRGVAYQQDSSAGGSDTPKSNATFIDSLVSKSNCERDIPNLVSLNTNLIRTYGVDPNGNHDDCMQMLADAGIYVIADLGNPTISINRADPQWNVGLFTFFQSVVDTMAKYPNVVGFFVGNEVTNSNTTTGASAYVKAAVRDMKQYVKDKNYHTGIGYAADDSSDLRNTIAEYMNCGDASDSVDFYGYNVYEWCGDSTFETSGYNRILDFFQSYSVPAFFAEYGCNKPGGAAKREWQETGALYAKNMTDVLSGGIVYEYFEEENDYGLVKASDSDSTVTKLDDFDTLEKAMKAVDPQGVSMSSYNPSNKAASCPSVNSSWEAEGSTLPPTPNQAACECAANASTCVPAANLDKSAYGAIFNYTCADASVCSEINGDPSTGKYGVYSMCSDEQKLAIVLGVYHTKHADASDSCSFGGNATTQKGSGKTDCSKLAPSSGSNSSNSSSKENAGATVGAPGYGVVVSLASLVALVASAMVSL